MTPAGQPTSYLNSTKTKIANVLEGNAASFRWRHIGDDLLKRLEDIEEFELAHDVIHSRRRNFQEKRIDATDPAMSGKSS